MQFVALVLAIAKAVPIIDRWLGLIVLEYVKHKQEQLIKLNKKIIEEALKLKDQRNIEDEEHSGEVSGSGDIVDSLPRMRH